MWMPFRKFPGRHLHFIFIYKKSCSFGATFLRPLPVIKFQITPSFKRHELNEYFIILVYYSPAFPAILSAPREIILLIHYWLHADLFM